MLAEAISLDGRALVIILIIGLLVVAASVAVVIGGFALAPRAARREGRAMGWWVLCLCLEGLFALPAIAALISGDSVGGLVVPLIVVGQLLVYRRAR